MAAQRRKDKEKALEELKENIFNAAMDIMKETDFESMTIREICSRVQISTGMFYKIYANKLELLSYYFEKAQSEYDLDIHKTLEGLPIEEQLLGFYRWVCDFTSKMGVDFCRHFFDSKNEVMNGTLFHNRLIQITDDLLTEAVEKGLVLSKGRTPHAISKELCIITKGTIFDWSANEGNYDLTEYTMALLERVLGSLL
ncbi:MAG: TetR/AcrR family transcriptional regulator [Blautia sp.]|nr:TetR/AcrR family transcriptional regulator [Blautia sp.]